MADQAAAKRTEQAFAEIWEEWSLTPSNDTLQACQAAIPALDAWLSQGESDPGIVVQGTQALLADAEGRSEALKPMFSPLSPILRPAWPASALGSSGDNRLLTQALLLACWPESPTGAYALVPLLLGTWPLQRYSQRVRPQLEAWVRRTLDFQQHAAAAQHDSDSSVQTLHHTLAASRALLSDGTYANLLQHVRNPVGHPNFNYAANQLVDMLARLQTSSQQMIESIEAVSSLLKQDTSPHLDLLFFAQARYSHTLAKPFRRVSDRDESLWWMATEFSERAASLPTEPSAALLLELAVGLGYRIEESHPIGEWMQKLYAVILRLNPPQHDSKARAALSDAQRKSLPLCDGLKAIVNQASFGLPVSWMRLRAEQHLPVSELMERASTEVGLDVGTALDLGDWLMLLFKELLLGRRIAKLSSPTAAS